MIHKSPDHEKIRSVRVLQYPKKIVNGIRSFIFYTRMLVINFMVCTLTDHSPARENSDSYCKKDR